MNSISERLSNDVRHHIEGKLSLHSRIEHLWNSRMTQLRNESDLSHEPLDRYRTSQLGPQNFHCNEISLFYVGAEINSGHSAAAQLSLVAVMSREEFGRARRTLIAGLRWSVRRRQDIVIF